MPIPRQQKLLKKQKLHLGELKDLVSEDNLCRSLYDEAVKQWGSYLQSPVNKVAKTSNLAFQFDEWGAFKMSGTSLREVVDTLFDWLETSAHPSINRWLSLGEPTSPEQANLIGRKLFSGKQGLTNASLYNQPVCRLVHRNQLRRDLDYQVIYQLTPGQSWLINPQEESPNKARSPQDLMKNLQDVMKDLRQNQRVYWGISETLQSLVAMFDSDLGSRKDSKAGTSYTKEFIRIKTEKSQSSSLAELNTLSPLRFWSPPPAFAGSVFHMLFWRSVITGQDLFGRPVIANDPEKASSPKERASQYYVIINWFNAAKFRLADYANLFEALMAIARRTNTAVRIGTKMPVNSDTPLRDLGDVDLSDEPTGEFLYPRYFSDSAVKFPQFEKVDLMLPFGSVEKKFELVWEHQDDKDELTRLIDVRKFLRDKALELILWSKYQMEIRSVGLIPIQYLYHVELTGEDKGQLVELSKVSKELDRERKVSPYSPEVRKLEEEINKDIFGAITSEQIDKWIVLRKVYGGTYRTNFKENEWRKIALLKSPRSDVVKKAAREVKNEISSSTSFNPQRGQSKKNRP